MRRARTLARISISLHALSALVLLSTRLASARTHSTLADLYCTDLNFRVRLSRAIVYSFDLNASISILYRITMMWLSLGCHDYVSLCSCFALLAFEGK